MVAKLSLKDKIWISASIIGILLFISGFGFMGSNITLCAILSAIGITTMALSFYNLGE